MAIKKQSKSSQLAIDLDQTAKNDTLMVTHSVLLKLQQISSIFQVLPFSYQKKGSKKLLLLVASSFWG
jgi:hypothetical protein